MERVAVLFTANTQGGIIQFTVQIYHVLKDQGYQVYVFIPNNVKNADLSDLKNDLFLYKKEKKIFNNKPYRDIAKNINSICPLLVWYMDDSAVSQKVGMYINSQIKQLVTVHDAGNLHPSNNNSVRTWFVQKYTKMLTRFFYKSVYRFVLLSNGSLNTFNSNFPAYIEKTCVMNLGAHVPKDEEVKPAELDKMIIGDYYLFFGRIDKYKGLETLLKTFTKASDCRFPLIIAGNGMLTEEEKKIADEATNVLVINRYIYDGEMKWLISHSMAVVLPYVEATQSGVIPLAYYYKKPVIVSNVYGLTQFVKNNETGFVAESDDQWIELFNNMTPMLLNEMNDSIYNYYVRYLDWNRNIQNVLNVISQ